jgi:hypothetical protein
MAIKFGTISFHLLSHFKHFVGVKIVAHFFSSLSYFGKMFDLEISHHLRVFGSLLKTNKLFSKYIYDRWGCKDRFKIYGASLYQFGFGPDRQTAGKSLPLCLQNLSILI